MPRSTMFAFVLALAAAPAGASALAVQVQDGAGRALADVVVYAEPEGGVSGKAGSADIEQRGLKFLPLVTVVQTGSKVFFPNNDKVRHHIYSFSPAHKFDQKLYTGQAALPQIFDKAGTVVLGCNIHDKMLAYVKVVDTPYFAKTDGNGAARIDLPAGKYLLRAWHYDAAGALSPEQAVQVRPGDGPTPAVFKIALKPPAGGNDAAGGNP